MTNSSRRPVSVWTAHLKDKTEFQKAVVNTLANDKVVLRLKAIISKMKKECEIILPEDAAWPYKRAYADGMIVAYDRILKLLETPNE